ncbi:hypothetical protein FFWV33_11370 [Flavobacterium faecale]|uniref:Uncharacterized protein n=1 Tax=Flavobacterium faecale TaxID=1355330 RepID=A0A2S1LEB2_9FLAO|nr:DUF6095 family protein [Flavobacterium faecale]AWG22067.1 hypothetical protein FFWV33_11370 [Flavobacterium faecale]
MATDKNTLSRGLKYLSGALPLLFLGPTVIYNAFMNQKNDWHYLVLAVGIIACISSVFLMFKGLQFVMKSIFND